MTEMPYKARLELRLTEQQSALVKEAAWIRRVTLSEWCRQVLVANAEQTVKENNERQRD